MSKSTPCVQPLSNRARCGNGVGCGPFASSSDPDVLHLSARLPVGLAHAGELATEQGRRRRHSRRRPPRAVNCCGIDVIRISRPSVTSSQQEGCCCRVVLQAWRNVQSADSCCSALAAIESAAAAAAADFRQSLHAFLSVSAALYLLGTVERVRALSRTCCSTRRHWAQLGSTRKVGHEARPVVQCTCHNGRRREVQPVQPDICQAGLALHAGGWGRAGSAAESANAGCPARDWQQAAAAAASHPATATATNTFYRSTLPRLPLWPPCCCR